MPALGVFPINVGLLVAAGSCWFSVPMVMDHSPGNCINFQTSQVLWSLRATLSIIPEGNFQEGLCRDLYGQW